MAFGSMDSQRRGGTGGRAKRSGNSGGPPGPPVIQANNQCLTVGTAFDPLNDAKAVDWDGTPIPLTREHVIYNDVDTGTMGIYTVTYQVTGTEGQTGTKHIYIGVVDPGPEYRLLSELIESMVMGATD